MPANSACASSSLPPGRESQHVHTRLMHDMPAPRNIVQQRLAGLVFRRGQFARGFEILLETFGGRWNHLVRTFDMRLEYLVTCGDPAQQAVCEHGRERVRTYDFTLLQHAETCRGIAHAPQSVPEGRQEQQRGDHECRHDTGSIVVGIDAHAPPPETNFHW